jgi:hypothetical protein
MKRSTMIAAGVLLSMAVAWAAYGQAGGGRGGFGQMREAQQKAMADLQEQVAKLKAMSEQAAQAMQGRNFQDMSDEERTKMREEMTKRNEEQRTILAAMQQDIDRLKGPRNLMMEHNESLKPLQELLATAKQENATKTAAGIERLIAERNKQFEEKITAMGYTMEQMQQMQRMGQRRGRQQ